MLPAMLRPLLAVALLPAASWAAAASPQQPAPVRAEAEEAAHSASSLELDARLLEPGSQAAERGLAWLAAQQLPSGAFAGVVGHKMQNDYVELDQALSVAEQRRSGHGHLGVSALCGMAFLAAGHLPDRGQHGQTVQRTVDYVIGCGADSGLLSDAGTRMYSHAFATLFLAEVYGMAGSHACKQALERAVNLIVDSQNRHGGWRYNPFDREIDLSVTVCQLQALRAARNIGIKVPSDTIERAVAYVMQSRVRTAGRRRSQGGQFYYKIHGRGAYEKPDEYAINAAALLALSSAGVYDREAAEPTLDFLERQYGDVADYYGRHYFFWYGNYYACQAFFQHGGGRFVRYYTRLQQDLLADQQGDGSWRNSVGPGPAFATAVACLLLQLPRQYLPIFQR